MTTTAQDPTWPTSTLPARPPVLVTDLRDLLGAKLVAYLGGVKEARAGRRHRQVAGDMTYSGRLAYKAARPFHPRRQPAVIQA